MTAQAAPSVTTTSNWVNVRCSKPHPKVKGWLCNGMMGKIGLEAVLKGPIVFICPRCHEETVLD